MPFYEYQCQSCGHLFEELQTMSEEPLLKCPKCGKDELKKLISGGSGLIFKGSGFYQTDYKKTHSTHSKGGSKPVEINSTEATKNSSAKETKSDSKPKTKSQNKDK